jgi:Na+/H+ antiporter NhaD/arsenite permease-like protein
MLRRAGATLISCLAAAPAFAADSPYAVPGASLGFLWALPFIGLLLSIALMPLAAPQVWHHHYGKIAVGWALAFVLPYLVLAGVSGTAYALVHTMLLEYVPFIILLFALYTVAGGIFLEGNLRGTPAVNSGLLAIGTSMASLVGTTGASMILIRPLIRANDDRRYRVHTVIFFIFLVSNIGGSLTPLGDPPLFLGFLRGVDFFWPLQNMKGETLLCVVVLLAAFFALDSYLHAKEVREHGMRRDPTPDTPFLRMHGLVNLPLLGLIIAALLLGAWWRPGVSFTVFGNEVPLQALARDALLLAIAGVSLAVSPKFAREGNGFNWGPIAEVAKLFFGIFVTIIPVLAMLQAGRNGAFAPLVGLVTNPDGTPNNAMYFWLTGGLSSFLDNAPTYLVFFELAGGDPRQLMTAGAMTLAAISCGAVFMGANSYIGNAPNFMVKAIAEDMGVKMPSFFGYMLWSGAVLVPLFVLVTLVFFR